MNRKKLRKFIKESGERYFNIAKKGEIMPILFVLKLYGIGEFRLWEIKNIINALNLDSEGAKDIFFASKVS